MAILLKCIDNEVGQMNFKTNTGYGLAQALYISACPKDKH